MGKGLLPAALIGLLIFTPGCQVGGLLQHNGTWSESYQFDGESISISGINGTITVDVWDQDIVQVRAKWSAKAEQYTFVPVVVHTPALLDIAVPADRNLKGVSFTLYVPGGVNLVLQTSNGSVSLVGELPIGDLDIRTSNGPVMVENPGTGRLSVNTSNGLIRIKDWQGQDIACNTSNGAITVLLDTVEAGNYSFITSNGGVTLELDQSSRFNLRARTSNGSISQSLPGAWSPQPHGQDYTGNFNGSGADITIRTSNGNILVRASNQ